MIEAYKVSKHRLYTGVVVTILVLFAMIFLFLICNAMSIMSAQEMAVSVDSLGNTVNLSEGAFSCSAKDIGSYSFYTNSSRIVISVDSQLDETMIVRLCSGKDNNESILLGRLDKRQRICYFTHLSTQNYYSITIDNAPDMSITARSRLTLWEALSHVMRII